MQLKFENFEKTYIWKWNQVRDGVFFEFEFGIWERAGLIQVEAKRSLSLYFFLSFFGFHHTRRSIWTNWNRMPKMANRIIYIPMPFGSLGCEIAINFLAEALDKLEDRVYIVVPTW